MIGIKGNAVIGVESEKRSPFDRLVEMNLINGFEIGESHGRNVSTDDDRISPVGAVDGDIIAVDENLIVEGGSGDVPIIDGGDGLSADVPRGIFFTVDIAHNDIGFNGVGNE